MPFGLCNALPTFQRLMQNCLGELNLTYCLIYLDDVIVFSKTPKEHLRRMHVVFDHLCEHGLKLKLSKCDVFKSEINYLAHHVSQKGVLPSKNLESIAQCPPPDTYTKVKSFMGLVGHYRHFIKGFAKIAAPLYDLTSSDNKDKRSEHVDLSPEARETFNRLKAACLQTPILAFPDFNKPFLLETDAFRRGLGTVLSQKQADGWYHPIAYASHIEGSHNLQLTVLYMSLKLPHFAHHNVVRSLTSRVQLCCIQYRMHGYGLISRANYKLVSHM